MNRTTLHEKFDGKYIPEPNSGCWLWDARVNEHGYGIVSQEGKRFYAHRLSWKFYRGDVPAGLCVLHRCDVPCCCNPDHLFLGTQADNNHDMDKKGRRVTPSRIGERNAAAVLTVEDVLKIRAMSESNAVIGRQFGVDRSTIYHIKQGKTWRHL